MATLPFLMSADLHGTLEQYRFLLELAEREGVARVLVSGDLVDARTVPSYLAVWRDEIFPLLEQHVARTGPLLVTMGNHDFASALPLLDSRPDLVRVLHAKTHPLGEGLSLVGYPYTTPTPYWVKDFEKWDTEEPGRDDYRPDGLRSVGAATERFELSSLPKSDTIAGDLLRLGMLAEPGRTVYLIHEPPHDTALDTLQGGWHIGSKAVRRFLELREPYLTLHGHIHETVEENQGEFRFRAGTALACSAGNHPRRTRMAVLGGDLLDRESIRRRVLEIG